MKSWSMSLLLITLAPGMVLSAPLFKQEASSKDPQARLLSLTLDAPAAARLSCQEQAGSRERLEVFSASSLTHTATVRGLKAATAYRCQAVWEGARPGSLQGESFITGPLPRDLKAPTISVPSSDVAQTGYTLYNYGLLRMPWLYANSYLVILDAEGNVRWYYKGPGAGDVDATWLGRDQILFGGAGETYLPPTLVNLDKEVVWQGLGAQVSEYEDPASVNHDAGISEDGLSSFFLTYSWQPEGWGSFVVKEVNLAGETTWSWDGAEDGVASGALPAGSAEQTDPHHANAVDDRWEDGRLYVYVGMRNQHAMLKVDYLTGEVVWRLGVGGDFELLEADGTPADDARWFFDCHDAKRMGSSVVIHDNGTDRGQYGGEAYSRLLRLELDEEAMTARIAYEYREPGWVEPIWGGADWLPSGNYLATIAHCWLCTGTYKSALVETNPQGQVVWRADFGNAKEVTYRSDRIPGCDIFHNKRYCPTLP